MLLMKNKLFFLFLFTNALFAQIEIKGTVYDIQGPLENVAVYLNNTMLGTTTNADGSFSLAVKPGSYELIISYLGYKKIVYPLETINYKKPLTFALEEEENVLDEIVIKKVVFDETWQNNFYVFRNEFLGLSEFAENCNILNPKVLRFNFDPKKNSLTAYAVAPLEINHKDLGYKITYELERFTKHKNYITYLGYSRYQPLKGGKRKQKRWQANRIKAYLGSQVHFYKSVINNTFTEEGFIVNQFKRVANKERPSEEAIQKARQIIRSKRNTIANLSGNPSKTLTAVDSAWVVVNKARLPKFRDYLYKSKLTQSAILEIINQEYVLSFENSLSVVYTKEKEEMNYLKGFGFRKKELLDLKLRLFYECQIVLF